MRSTDPLQPSIFLVFATVFQQRLGDIHRLYVPCSVILADFLVSSPKFATGRQLTASRRFCGVDWLTNGPYYPKHVHLDLPLVAKNWNLFFRIHLSAEVESVYFKCLLTKSIDYEHARSSSSAVDEVMLGTITRGSEPRAWGPWKNS
jgi:hypothetical protein